MEGFLIPYVTFLCKKDNYDRFLSLGLIRFNFM